MLKNTWLVSNVPVHSWARSPFLRNMLLVLFFGNSVHLLQMVGGSQEGKARHSFLSSCFLCWVLLFGSEIVGTGEVFSWSVEVRFT